MRFILALTICVLWFAWSVRWISKRGVPAEVNEKTIKKHREAPRDFALSLGVVAIVLFYLILWPLNESWKLYVPVLAGAFVGVGVYVHMRD